ncbi:flavoprotein NrdI [Weissella coleopterorum]|uniref:Flavoprotein NrdI n=1 Tax=Weissella coleopterorum TaxID=2714949 RepID=A0A6G8B005_9LACO|nr:class Ib ribonucleoside-diphosphate reductase assembly flavoprotein NrdI [Weissella coleopterorum]QIL50549.1 flavoprotein NrdI [Weissella coleopterorum]
MVIQLLYTSIAGNTKNFIKNFIKFAQNEQSNYQFQAIEISDNTQITNLDSPAFVFVPTYLDGGNGIHSGVQEILTNSLFEFIDDLPDKSKILGIIGSGNKNFNAQYILTARRYAIQWGIPLIDNFELRGVPTDTQRIFKSVMLRLNQFNRNETIKFNPTNAFQCITNSESELLLIDEKNHLVSPIFFSSNINLDPSLLTLIKVEKPDELYSIQVKALTMQHYWFIPKSI